LSCADFLLIVDENYISLLSGEISDERFQNFNVALLADWQMLSFKKVFQSTDYIGYCTAKTLVKNQLFSAGKCSFRCQRQNFCFCAIFCAIFASCAKVQKLQVTRLQGVQVVASSCNFPTSSPSTPP